MLQIHQHRQQRLFIVALASNSGAFSHGREQDRIGDGWRIDEVWQGVLRCDLAVARGFPPSSVSQRASGLLLSLERTLTLCGLKRFLFSFQRNQ